MWSFIDNVIVPIILFDYISYLNSSNKCNAGISMYVVLLLQKKANQLDQLVKCF